jgi:hypothetical protein
MYLNNFIVQSIDTCFIYNKFKKLFLFIFKIGVVYVIGYIKKKVLYVINYSRWVNYSINLKN